MKKQKKDKEQKEHKKPWREVYATVEDIQNFLMDFVPEYNPFTFYLEHLPPWDGKDDYILELSLSVCVRGDEQTQWQFYEYLRKWREVELVHLYFRKPVGVESGEFIPVGRALQLIGGNMVHELSAIRLGRAFTELGFELKHTKTGNYYRVVQRSAQEIQCLLRCIPEDG